MQENDLCVYWIYTLFSKKKKKKFYNVFSNIKTHLWFYELIQFH